jgi:hypothetical protein
VKIDLQTVASHMWAIVVSAWAIVALAGLAPFILSSARGDEVLRFLRSRSTPILPIDWSELKDQIRQAARLTVLLTVLAVACMCYTKRNNQSALQDATYTGIVLPALMTPVSIGHTVLIRFLAFRGLVVSIATGLVVGSIVAAIIHDYQTPLILLGGGYGVIAGVRQHMLTSRGIVPDERIESTE